MTDEQEKELRAMFDWLKANPNKTFRDYIKEVGK